MEKIDETSLAKAIEKSTIITQSDILNNLHIFPHTSAVKELVFEFLLIRCEKRKIREDDFLAFLHRFSGLFALRRDEARPQEFENMSKEELERFFLRDFIDMAKTASSRYSKKDEYAGDMGELLLFILLESKGIAQLLNKLSLKTSPNKAVNGLDGIHIQVDGKNIVLHYGQSKVKKDFDKALDGAISDVKNFISDPTKEDHEFSLARKYIDRVKFGEQAEKIPFLLSPYYRHMENLVKVNSVLLGYEWDFLSKLNPSQVDDFTNHILAEYEKERKIKAAKTGNRVSRESAISGHKHYFFVIPYRDLTEMRKKWNKMIGAEIGEEHKDG